VIRIDQCLDVLRRLIATGDTNGILLAEKAVEEYWEGTPARARKSGLLYIQQILHDARDRLGPESRAIADNLDAYIEKKLASFAGFACRSMSAHPRKRPTYCAATK
jgi:hypothetical protein